MINGCAKGWRGKGEIIINEHEVNLRVHLHLSTMKSENKGISKLQIHNDKGNGGGCHVGACYIGAS